MKYHAHSEEFTVPLESIKRASILFIWAIRNIRLGHGLDPKGYTYQGPLEHHHFAEAGILDAAAAIGIDLGSHRPGRLDVS